MVRSARQRASRTMGNLHRSRPWPVLRDGASRLLRTRLSVGYCRPHGEERASARVSNHGQLAPLSPVARPSRPAFGGRLRTRLTRGMAGFVVNNNESTRPLSCKRPTLSGAGRNSNCGFSPIIFSQDCQKERCQESCQRGLIFPLFPAVPDAGAMSMNYLFRLRSSLRESRQSRAQRRVGDMSY